MGSWSEFEHAAPEFAERVKALMTGRKHLTMATLRRDGSPRISGIEVEFRKGALRIGSMPAAVKGMDLRRDPRVAIHGPTQDPPDGNPPAWVGEAKVAGTAIEVEPDRFEIDVREAVITRLNAEGSRLVVESWNPDRGYRVIERD
ncbi:MAG TPA: pyridoxamine 5'-phosphate oxidase family protein [Candidatus Dormibacteraeota bacterium]